MNRKTALEAAMIMNDSAINVTFHLQDEGCQYGPVW